MMNYITIVIFAILVMPIALKEHKRVKEVNKLIKITNVVICFILFYSFTNTVRDGIFSLYSTMLEFKEMLQSEMNLFLSILYIIAWLIFMILSFILSIIVVLLAIRKEKSRVLFLKLIPFLWILKSIDLYRYSLNNVTNVSNSHAIIFFFTLVGVICLLLFILYSSKPLKYYFQYKE